MANDFAFKMIVYYDDGTNHQIALEENYHFWKDSLVDTTGMTEDILVGIVIGKMFYELIANPITQMRRLEADNTATPVKLEFWKNYKNILTINDQQ